MPPASAAGSISGNLDYPSEFTPAQAVYAISTDGGAYYRVESVGSQRHFTMLGVAAGDYFVFTAWFVAVRAGHPESLENGRFGAGYTKFVLCGEAVSCLDHSLVPVHVIAGLDTPNINPRDWYGTVTYPLVPQGGPPHLILPNPPAVFAASQSAAVDEAQYRTSGIYVSQPQNCPVNFACVWFTSFTPGENAAYYVGEAGSNSDLMSCAFYVLGSNAAGWQEFNVGCRAGATAFPARGSTGLVEIGKGETGCVNVHASPGASARVVACLAAGSSVTIDDGPVYTATSAIASGPRTFLDVWWHIAGRGWMVHQYLQQS